MIRTAIAFVLVLPGGFAQSGIPAFDVASIKPHGDGIFAHQFEFLAGGRLHAINTWIEYAIEQAWDLKSYQVSGGPPGLPRSDSTSKPKPAMPAPAGRRCG